LFFILKIAAPYDGQDSSGIVYIYHGGPNGLQIAQPSQVIKGSDYSMKSFGYSLSGGLDLDENSYPDLIVGAYKSDAVAFIRAKPVIKTLFNTQTTPKFIDLNSEENYCSSSISTNGAKQNSSRICINLEYCVHYFGKALPDSLRMLYSIELDVDKHHNKSLTRVYFANSKTYKLFMNYTFKYDENKCFREMLYLKKTIRDKLTPIKIRFNYSLPQYDSDWELMPIFNVVAASSEVQTISSNKVCLILIYSFFRKTPHIAPRTDRTFLFVLVQASGVLCAIWYYFF
jgi:hypothetical protein